MLKNMEQKEEKKNKSINKNRENKNIECATSESTLKVKPSKSQVN